MINIISALIFSLSANIDNIALGIAYGIKKIHISFFSNFLIALCTSIISITFMKLSVLIFSFFSESIANFVGAFLLILIGIYEIINFLYNKDRQNKKNETRKNTQKNLKAKELFLIIFTLSANNISVGIATSIAGIHMLTAFFFTFIFSFIFLYIGNKLGKKLKNSFISKYSDILAAFLLIILGIINFI